MNEAVTEADLQAWHDGRLAADRRAQVDEWLAAHPHDAERFGAYRDIDMQLRERFGPILEQPVPPRLAMSLQPQPHRMHRMQRMQRIAAAWLLAVCSAAAGWFGHDVLQAASPNDLARQAAIAHAVFSPEVRHPVEVVAAQKAHLSAWLSKRLNTQLTLPQLDALGYTLVGGRLLTGNHGAVAQLMYRDDSGRRVTLYVSPEYVANDAEKAGGFAAARIAGLNVVYWSDEHFGCAITGDLPQQELMRIGHAAYGQLDES